MKKKSARRPWIRWEDQVGAIDGARSTTTGALEAILDIGPLYSTNQEECKEKDIDIRAKQVTPEITVWK